MSKKAVKDIWTTETGSQEPQRLGQGVHPSACLTAHSFLLFVHVYVFISALQSVYFCPAITLIAGIY